MQFIVPLIIFILFGNAVYAAAPKKRFILKCEVGSTVINNSKLQDGFFMPKCGDNNLDVGDYRNNSKKIPYDVFVSMCKRVYDVGKIQNIELWGVTNNLIHNANNPENVDMQVIIIQGRLLDAHCVPISDATVRIMQPSLMSKHVDYKELTEDENKNLLLVREARGTATAITNNLGLFTLITRLPSVGKLTSTISLYILHPDFTTHYETISSNSKNVYTLDALFPDLNIKQYIPLYRHDIILNQLNKYRTF
ncbi:MAG: hypothetical protein AB8U25_02480 [Rickettsiales endosymbiont of Dermacentor nuttalli]